MFLSSIKKITERLVSVSMAVMICAGVVLGQEQKLTLDEAIVESIKYLSGKLDAGTGVVYIAKNNKTKLKKQ